MAYQNTDLDYNTQVIVFMGAIAIVSLKVSIHCNCIGKSDKCIVQNSISYGRKEQMGLGQNE